MKGGTCYIDFRRTLYEIEMMEQIHLCEGRDQIRWDLQKSDRYMGGSTGYAGWATAYVEPSYNHYPVYLTPGPSPAMPDVLPTIRLRLRAGATPRRTTSPSNPSKTNPLTTARFGRTAGSILPFRSAQASSRCAFAPPPMNSSFPVIALFLLDLEMHANKIM